MKQVWIAYSQLLNALTGGYADESFSSRCWRLRERQPFRILRAVIDGLFFWDGAHCKGSYESELLRAQLPPELR